MPRLLILLFAAAVFLLDGARPGRAEDVHVFAAASLKTALDQVAQDWTAETGKTAIMVYAGTPALAKQIGEGAPADLFISADEKWMDELAAKSLIRPETRQSLLGNTLVLVAPQSSAASVDLAAGGSLAAALNGGRLAVADVKSVPAGRYAKAALETLGLWGAVEGQLAQTENVRAALALVARGEAPLGIVYGSDAVADSTVKVLATFPETSHPPIRYPVAQVAASANPDAAVFQGYLSSAAARRVFESNGFALVTP